MDQLQGLNFFLGGGGTVVDEFRSRSLVS